MRRLRQLGGPLPAVALAGCSDIQSALAPGGETAAMVLDLSIVMVIGGTLVVGLVIALLWLAVRPRAPRWLARRETIVGLGLAFPAVTVTALLIFSVVLHRQSTENLRGDAIVVRVTAEQWWWRIAYLGPDRAPRFETANEVRLPVGQPVRIELVSADVIHSFWVPALGGKLDVIPGRTNAVTLLAERPGTYRGQCAEFCGSQHALMAFMAVALEPDAFARWLAQEETGGAEPATAEQAAGRTAFLAHGCGACHTIRGTGAEGTIGPDLTHVGGRLTIAGGTLSNHAGTLAGWISDAQAIKPGARMPSFDELTGPELRAIAVYLESLR